MILKRAAVLIATLSLLDTGLLTAQTDNAAILSQGKIAYDAQCARCHGADGKGDGWEAHRLYVAPRDLTSGRFKFKTTEQGTPPSDDDLINGIIGHGVTGSGMPSFANLEMDVKKALVAYIKSISPAFQWGVEPKPIPGPSNMRAAVDLEKGAKVYEKLQCALCHGAQGRANGTSAFTLVDAWGKPIKVTNLVQGWTYGGGPRAIDVYHRILAGIDGAPMPSYEGALTHEEVWLLSKYVESLQIKANWSTDIHVLKADGALPANGNDNAWDRARRTDVILDGYWTQKEQRIPLSVNAVSVQAIANNEAVVFRLVWDDPVKNEGGIPDALMMAIKPPDFSGDPRANLHTLYAPDAPPLDLTLWQANDAGSIRHKKSNLHAASSASWNPAKLSNAAVTFDDGRWTLVLARSLTDGSLDLSGALEKPLQVGFAIWDGNNNEVQQKRPCSQWIRLQFASGSENRH